MLFREPTRPGISDFGILISKNGRVVQHSTLDCIRWCYCLTAGLLTYAGLKRDGLVFGRSLNAPTSAKTRVVDRSQTSRFRKSCEQ